MESYTVSFIPPSWSGWPLSTNELSKLHHPSSLFHCPISWVQWFLKLWTSLQGPWKKYLTLLTYPSSREPWGLLARLLLCFMAMEIQSENQRGNCYWKKNVYCKCWHDEHSSYETLYWFIFHFLLLHTFQLTITCLVNAVYVKFYILNPRVLFLLYTAIWLPVYYPVFPFSG